MGSAAHAQPPQQITVLVEFDSDNNRRCGITHNVQKDSASQILRSHGYDIDARQEAPLTAYVNTIAVAQAHDCSLSIQFQLYYSVSLRAPWGTTYRSKVVLCERLYVANGPYSFIPSKVQEIVASLTELCVKEEEQKRR
jgi:hypothetical protein